MRCPFELFLFSTDRATIQAAVRGGVSSVVVDWERKGKRHRQAGADTQIGTDDLADLVRVRAATRNRVVCRVNGVHPDTPRELEQAIDAGADEVLVPMVRSAEEVWSVLERAAGRCGVGILVETREAVACAEELAELPLARVYMGLNDLAIERRTGSIFEPFVDGVAEEVRAAFSVPFGVGGLTLPHRGSPVPCRLLLGELARLECDFTFLRRSYLRDVTECGHEAAVPRIQAAIGEAQERDEVRVARDHDELRRVLGPVRTAVA